MVTYEQWVEAVNEAYKAQGGTYVEGTASELIQLAAQFWQRNKEELKTIAYREAVRLAQSNLDV
jgi:hypothetical protein